MPLAIEQFDLREYDLVLSSSHAVAKGVLTNSEQIHISYVHTPIRYAWDLYQEYLHAASLVTGVRSVAARAALHYLRLWDVQAANRVDEFVANSEYVARRIRKTYRRDATVIYPPVDISRFSWQRAREDFYLTVSRLVPYKKVDLIVNTFNQLKLPLVVVGGGPDEERIRKLAGRNVQVLGSLADQEVTDRLERCRAFVFAADEDFGITPVEAQAAGAPVIAFGRGGARETVVEGETGLFFHAQTPESLGAAITKFEQMDDLDAETIRTNACRFGADVFARRIAEHVRNLLDEKLP